MSRSQQASHYAPPDGFILGSSRSPGVEVYAPVSGERPPRCGGCTALRTATPCSRCGAVELLTGIRLAATLDEAEAKERLQAWLDQALFPVQPARDAVLERVEVPCDQDGRVLGGLNLERLAVGSQGEPCAELPPLDRDPAPLSTLVVVPVWVARFEWRGRRGQVVINGFDGTVSGDRPVDFGRLRRSALLGTVPAVALGLCLGLPTLLLAGFGVLIWGAALLTMLVAHRRWARMERTALEQQRW